MYFKKQGNALLNNIQVNLKSINDEDFLEYLNSTLKNLRTEDLQFLSNLIAVVLYFQNINHTAKCDTSSNIDDFQIQKSNLMKIINFIEECAMNYHFYKNSFNLTFSDEPKTINDKKIKLMTSKCELPLKENSDTYLALWIFFKTYLKYYLVTFSNFNHTDCYLDSLVSFKEIKLLISHFDYKNPNINRSVLNYKIMSTLQRIKLCIVLQVILHTINRI